MEKENLKENLKEQAEKHNLKFNPDGKKVESVLKALQMRKEKKGNFFCPCRILQEDEEKNKKIICICEFVRKGENCICGLFVR